MDIHSDVTLPNQTSGKPNKFKAMFLIEIGIFELGFVAFFLLIVLGSLNYFNILNVSGTLPFLHFLPHAHSQFVKTIYQKPLSADQMVTKALQNNLNATLLKGQKEQAVNNGNYDISWQNLSDLYALTIFTPNNSYANLRLVITFPRIPSIESAKIIVASYFLESFKNIDCQQQGINAIMCVAQNSNKNFDEKLSVFFNPTTTKLYQSVIVFCKKEKTSNLNLAKCILNN